MAVMLLERHVNNHQWVSMIGWILLYLLHFTPFTNLNVWCGVVHVFVYVRFHRVIWINKYWENSVNMMSKIVFIYDDNIIIYVYAVLGFVSKTGSRKKNTTVLPK